MGKFIVRLTIVGVAIYLLVAYLLAQFVGIDILANTYTLAFELCVVVYSYSEGKYHCKFIKHTMLAIFICDTFTRLNYLFKFIPEVSSRNIIPAIILALGIGVSLTQALIHFHKVNKIKKIRNERRKETLIGNQENGTQSD